MITSFVGVNTIDCGIRSDSPIEGNISLRNSSISQTQIINEYEYRCIYILYNIYIHVLYTCILYIHVYRMMNNER